jgi:uncharacterized protein YndB with AHSA1/START domain
MRERSVAHSTFVIERVFDATPAQVFSAWADPGVKRRWFSGPDEWDRGPHELDFRVGGRERASGGPSEGPTHLYEAIYEDIVPNQRIVYSYVMHLDGRKISVSLSTVELLPAGAGTRMIYTEQDAFLDGADTPAEREHGSRELFDKLADVLREPLEP